MSSILSVPSAVAVTKMGWAGKAFMAVTVGNLLLLKKINQSINIRTSKIETKINYLPRRCVQLSDRSADKRIPQMNSAVTRCCQSGCVNKRHAQKGFPMLLVNITGRHTVVSVSLIKRIYNLLTSYHCQSYRHYLTV